MVSGRQPLEFTTIDMTPDGRIVPPPARITWPVRIAIGAAIVAAVAALAASAVILLWLASILIPIALVAGLIGYAALRFQVWRMRRSGAGGRTTLDLRRFRP